MRLFSHYAGNWLWYHLHWWSIPVCVAIVVVSAVLRMWAED